mmetsp:Transcript_13034/g.24906  ORF Transcript_13034/g.24906 Transcript_13034/m.24906 type:complete len:242 (-) Transcript_13034:316-1041(-)
MATSPCWASAPCCLSARAGTPPPTCATSAWRACKGGAACSRTAPPSSSREASRGWRLGRWPACRQSPAPSTASWPRSLTSRRRSSRRSSSAKPSSSCCPCSPAICKASPWRRRPFCAHAAAMRSTAVATARCLRRTANCPARRCPPAPLVRASRARSQATEWIASGGGRTTCCHAEPTCVIACSRPRGWETWYTMTSWTTLSCPTGKQPFEPTWLGIPPSWRSSLQRRSKSDTVAEKPSML